MSFACLLLSLHLRSSFVSVVLDFSASLNDVAPMSLMLLTVEVMRNDKSELLMGALCISFCLYSKD